MFVDPGSPTSLDALLHDGLDRGLYLGAVYAVVHDGEIVAEGTAGRQTEAPDRPVSRETIFDLASLTKPIATATSILLLAQEGRFHLGEEVAAFLPEGQGARLAGITLRHLLTHTSGLPAWRDFHSHGWSREEIIARVAASDREHQIGARYVYSDLGYILLGAVVEAVAGEGLDVFSARRIFAPLGMASTGYRPTPDRLDRLAATRCPRRGILQGPVHDENAAAMDGIAGHAGLFGTAPDLARYAAGLLRSLRTRIPFSMPTRQEGEADDQDDQGDQDEEVTFPSRSSPPHPGHPGHLLIPLAPLVARQMARNTLDPAVGGSSFGWFTPPNGMLPAGDFLPDDAFGHTGFTGTSLLLVPSLGLAVILLTNRVYQECDAGPFLRFRRRFHNAVAETLREYAGAARTPKS